jgi:mannose-1-phosphate guanylyltransferase
VIMAARDRCGQKIERCLDAQKLAYLRGCAVSQPSRAFNFASNTARRCNVMNHEETIRRNILTQLKANVSSSVGRRAGIVLSAGDGRRLQDFVRLRHGYDLPKQYINFVGTRSMLEHTWHRAERSIPAHRLVAVVAKQHLRFREVRRQLSNKSPLQMVVQPANRETLPGILLPLLFIHKRHPDAIVAIFPSDHFVLEEARFMSHVDRAFRMVESDTSRLVLLGLEPNEPDPEYGYVVPGARIDASGSGSARQVELFVEKPPVEAAKQIISSGALWNTMVMVFTCETLLSVVKRAAPDLYRSFRPIREAIGTAFEQRVIERVYRTLPSSNFSKDILETLPVEFRRSLVVLPVRGVTWSDWGTHERLSSMLRKLSVANHVQLRHSMTGKITRRALSPLAILR